MSSVWAPKNFINSTHANSLKGAVNRLSPKAKQAFYAASISGPINRGTWNGCAFNAGGDILGEDVRNFDAAAVVFEMKVHDVQSFIQQWDTFRLDLSNVDATDLLRDYLLESGLYETSSGSVGTFVVTLHKGPATVDQEFQELVDQLGDPETMSEFKEAAILAESLLDS